MGFLNFINLNIDTQFSKLITYIVLLQQVNIYCCIFLTLLVIFSFTLNLTLNKNYFVLKILSLTKYFSILLLSISCAAIIIKFSLYLINFKSFIILKNSNLELNIDMSIFNTNILIVSNGSALSDVIILLGFTSGLICIFLLGEKNINNYFSNVNTFSLFFIATSVMVYTTNLLVMFISFELLFLPTIYFIYAHGYVARTDKTLKILYYWTLSGAFLILVSLSYLFFKYKTLNLSQLSTTKFSLYENWFLTTFILIGFGVKIPIFPFHYWLTKIHVEAPAGFSIFLSGFLVKTALYCFFQFNLIFSTNLSIIVICCVTLFGVIESSVKLWTQTDLKKLIAYATIQEMNLILFLLIGSQNKIDYTVLLFILVHGYLSSLMFLLVDIIQKKTQTRNIVELSGLCTNLPKAKLLIWFIIFIFMGFPLTIKFSIEWQILSLLTIYSLYTQLLVLIIIAVIGVVGFVKQMFIIMYGVTDDKKQISPIISKRDTFIIYFIIVLLIIFNFLNFFFI